MFAYNHSSCIILNICFKQTTQAILNFIIFCMIEIEYFGEKIENTALSEVKSFDLNYRSRRSWIIFNFERWEFEEKIYDIKKHRRTKGNEPTVLNMIKIRRRHRK